MSANFDPTKPAYQKTEYSQEQIVDLIQCESDPFYFIKNHIKIQTDKGIEPLELYPFQFDMVDAFHNHKDSVVLTARQCGKALALDTSVITPNGFTTVGDISVGDTIYGQDGKPTTVTYITETMHDRPCYDIEFSTGETITADAEHLWTVNIPAHRGKMVQTVTTTELIALLDHHRKGGQGISITHCEPVEFANTDAVIDPYFFGVWLGDGNSWQNRITCHVDDYPHYVEQASLRGVEVGAFTPDKRRPTTGYFSLLGEFKELLTPYLKSKKDRLNGKRIPDEMIFTSVENRLDLIRGLMDTDGYISKRGHCQFYQSDEEFTNRVALILSSLGIKNKSSIKKTPRKDCHVLTFSSTTIVFSLARKVERQAMLKQHPKINRIFIKSIAPVASVPVRCLQVNNDDHLFLCGKSLIPTHNTTTAAAYLLHFAMFNDDKTILIVSNVFRAALEVMHRVRSMYELCPDHVRAGVKTFNKTSIEFDNGSRIVSQATTSNTGRGMTIHLLYVDEMAFCPPNIIEDLWTSVSPTLAASKGKSIITSTPNSDVDMFARIWQGANDLTDEYGNPDPACQNGEGKNGYYAYSATWDKNPSRSKEWAIKEEAKIGKQKFLQEHCCHFVGSDETLINSMYLSSLKYKTEPEFYTGTVRWYVEPQPNRTYLIALDPSLGTGGDYSAIQVFMLPEMEQVAEWQNNTTPAKGQIRTLMQILHTIDGDLREHPDQHGDPEIYWTVENNTIGEAVLQIIEDTGEDRFPGQMINEKKKKGSSRRFRKGLNTDNRKKLSSCAKLKSLIESKRMTIHSRNLVTELKNFIARGASYAAKPGTHDDLVSATLLVTRMLETVIEWSGGGDALKERIGDDELFGDEDGLFAQDEDSAPMPTVV